LIILNNQYKTNHLNNLNILMTLLWYSYIEQTISEPLIFSLVLQMTNTHTHVRHNNGFPTTHFLVENALIFYTAFPS
jgi:hypothetical protein